MADASDCVLALYHLMPIIDKGVVIINWYQEVEESRGGFECKYFEGVGI